jgi:DNA primase catalytic subunit
MPGFEPSTLEQRKEFYSNEFDEAKAMSWFKENKLPLPQLLAVDMGSETGIIKDKSKKGKVISLRNENVRKKMVGYLPEDLYYDRNQYKDAGKILKELNFKEVINTTNFIGQELAFDIDPENIKCGCKKKFPGFCERCMAGTVDSALGLADFLRERFKSIGFVYSGRGMHVHVFDKEAFDLSVEERDEINKGAMRYHIDPWVSKGYIRLMRLPYSLNGIVSRVVIPLSMSEAKGFNPLHSEKSIPSFLK